LRHYAVHAHVTYAVDALAVVVYFPWSRCRLHLGPLSLKFLVNDFDAIWVTVANVSVIEKYLDVLRVVTHAAHNTISALALVFSEVDALASLEPLAICALNVLVSHDAGLSFTLA
jgi:hypothetical protein